MNKFTARFHQSNGGGERDRTDDLLLAKQALSQLSYTPISGICPIGSASSWKAHHHVIMVGLRRVELLTSPLSGVRSNQLSYRPVVACISFADFKYHRPPTQHAGSLATDTFQRRTDSTSKDMLSLQFRGLEGMRGQRHGLFFFREDRNKSVLILERR